MMVIYFMSRFLQKKNLSLRDKAFSIVNKIVDILISHIKFVRKNTYYRLVNNF